MMMKLSGLCFAVLLMVGIAVPAVFSAAERTEKAVSGAVILPEKQQAYVFKADLPSAVPESSPEAGKLRVVRLPGVRRRVRLLREGRVVEMDLEDYVTGVTAAEIPATFSPEAIKAQAVAARSHTLYLMLCNGGRGRHDAEGADVCDCSAHCKSFVTRAEGRARWGDSWYEKSWPVIEKAVRETAGQVLIWDEKPVMAVFHAASGGRTRSAQSVWGGSVPYLVSVESAGEEQLMRRYLSEKTMTAAECRTALEKLGCTVSGDPAAWVGRIGEEDIELCGKKIRISDARKAFALRSGRMEIDFRDGCFHFVTRGAGHGVGMSQYGAEYMARCGKSCGEILRWYYQDTELVQVKIE